MVVLAAGDARPGLNGVNDPETTQSDYIRTGTPLHCGFIGVA
jgi:hypothetical protein